MIRPGGLRYDAQCARLGAGLRYNNCIMAEWGATLCRNTVQPGAVIRRRGAATRTAARDTTRAHDFGAGCVMIQAATRPATSHDTAGHRPTTRLAWA